MMVDKIMQTVYDLWVNSEEYSKDSPLENEQYKNCTDKVLEIIGESAYHKISDEVTGLACDAEIAGFDSGFRYGIMFMNGVLKRGGSIGGMENG